MIGQLSMDFITGATVMAVVLLAANQLYKIYLGWVKAAGSDRKPQVVVHTTNKTPSAVVTGARRARFRLFLIRAAILVGVASIAGERLSPGIVRDTLALALLLVLSFLKGIEVLIQQLYRFLF